jgi:hypothetical protein
MGTMGPDNAVETDDERWVRLRPDREERERIANARDPRQGEGSRTLGGDPSKDGGPRRGDSSALMGDPLLCLVMGLIFGFALGFLVAGLSL